MATCQVCSHPLHVHRPTDDGDQRCRQFGCRCVRRRGDPLTRGLDVVVDVVAEPRPERLETGKRAEARRAMRALSELLSRIGDRAITPEEAAELTQARAAAGDAVEAAVTEIFERKVTP